MKNKLIPKHQQGKIILPSISISTNAPSKKLLQRGQLIMNLINSLKQQGYNHIADQFANIYNEKGYNAAVNYLVEAQDKLNEARITNNVVQNIQGGVSKIAIPTLIKEKKELLDEIKRYYQALAMRRAMQEAFAPPSVSVGSSYKEPEKYPQLSKEFRDFVKDNFKNDLNGYLNIYTYLYNYKDQANAFYDNGYIPGFKKDYGLVKKAVGRRNLPVYQMYPDETVRDSLDVIGNFTYDDEHGEYIPGLDKRKRGNRNVDLLGHPIAVYKHKHSGDIYAKAWDLTDFGLKSAGKGGWKYPGIYQLAANALDVIGSPNVITTGFVKVDNPKELEEYINIPKDKKGSILLKTK